VHVSAIDIIVGGLVELIETIAYHLSNSMSFLRVGAFALSHAVLSFVVFTMAGLVRGNGVGSFLGRLVIYVIGNAVILVLEGLIVVIQAIRLQYYEFFSKFFTGSGRPFRPLRLE
ncbi:MAG: V-type ATPase 116kDa subunit family protein, partial [Rectinemataceae bacterium]